MVTEHTRVGKRAGNVPRRRGDEDEWRTLCTRPAADEADDVGQMLHPMAPSSTAVAATVCFTSAADRLDAAAEIEAQDDARGADAQQHSEGQREQDAADGPQEDLRRDERAAAGR